MVKLKISDDMFWGFEYDVHIDDLRADPKKHVEEMKKDLVRSLKRLGMEILAEKAEKVNFPTPSAQELNFNRDTYYICPGCFRKIVGFCGGAGVGKDTAAQVFIDNGYTKIAFADPLKEIGLILGFKEKELYGTQEEKLVVNSFWGVSGRSFMQRFGTEVMRESLSKLIPEMERVWIRLFEKRLAEHRTVVVSDVRFSDEARAIRNAGGKVYGIIRDTGYQSAHASESINQIECDEYIDNNGTLGKFIQRISQLV